MKIIAKLLCVLYAIVILAGCSSGGIDVMTKHDFETTEYHISQYDCPVQSIVSFVSNGKNAACISSDANINPKQAASISIDDNDKLAFQEILFPGIAELQLLGIGDEGSYWVCGIIDEQYHLIQTAKSGEYVLDVNLSEFGTVETVRSFACDERYIYVTAECYTDTLLGPINAYDALYVINMNGEMVSSCSREDITAATIGFLEEEEEWYEELETDEELPGQIFAPTVKDRQYFTELSNGDVCLVIERSAPIGTETYCIICKVKPGTLEVEPCFSYEVNILETIAYNFPIVGADIGFDLLFMDTEGILGINLDETVPDRVLKWEDIDDTTIKMSANNLAQSVVGISRSEMLFEIFDSSDNRYKLLSVDLQT